MRILVAILIFALASITLAQDCYTYGSTGTGPAYGSNQSNGIYFSMDRTKVAHSYSAYLDIPAGGADITLTLFEFNGSTWDILDQGTVSAAEGTQWVSYTSTDQPKLYDEGIYAVTAYWASESVGFWYRAVSSSTSFGGGVGAWEGGVVAGGVVSDPMTYTTQTNAYASGICFIDDVTTREEVTPYGMDGDGYFRVLDDNSALVIPDYLEAESILSVAGNTYALGDLVVSGSARFPGGLATIGGVAASGAASLYIMGGNASNMRVQFYEKGALRWTAGLSGATDAYEIKAGGTLNSLSITSTGDVSVPVGDLTVDKELEVGTDAYVLGNLDVTGTSTLDGAVTAGSNLSVAGTSTLAGSTTTSGTLEVENKTWLYDDLDVAGASALDGTVTAGSNLSVAGTSTLAGNTTTSGTLEVENKGWFYDDLDVAGSSETGGNAYVYGTLHAWGPAADVSGSLSVSERSSLTGDVKTSGTLAVENKTWLYDDLSVAGTADIGVDLNVTADIDARDAYFDDLYLMGYAKGAKLCLLGPSPYDPYYIQAGTDSNNYALGVSSYHIVFQYYTGTNRGYVFRNSTAGSAGVIATITQEGDIRAKDDIWASDDLIADDDLMVAGDSDLAGTLEVGSSSSTINLTVSAYGVPNVTQGTNYVTLAAGSTGYWPLTLSEGTEIKSVRMFYSPSIFNAGIVGTLYLNRTASGSPTNIASSTYTGDPASWGSVVATAATTHTVDATSGNGYFIQVNQTSANIYISHFEITLHKREY